MPRFAATALGWTGGWACHPPYTNTPGQSRRLVGRAGWMRAGASEGRQDSRSDTVAEWAPNCHHRSRAPPPTELGCPVRQPSGPSVPQEPTAAHSLVPPQLPLPGSSPLGRPARHRQPVSQPLPPLPSQPGPLPLAASPSHRALLARIPPPPPPTPQHLAQGPCPQGRQGKLHPNSSQELL